MSNKSQGTAYEKQVARALSQAGFWVHLLQQNSIGQPADIIAVKDNVSYLIDCKLCSSKGFSLRRIEENQEMAMRKWGRCGNTDPLFAMGVEGDTYIISYYVLMHYKRTGTAYLSNQRIKEVGIPYEKWVMKCTL